MPLPKQIFLDSLDLPADQRQAFIERHCADDASLLSRVRALLQAHQAAGGFLDQSPAITIDPSDDPRGSSASGEKIGDVVGRYSLIRKLGEGGFGIVYLAEQSEPVVRQVALKVIRAGWIQHRSSRGLRMSVRRWLRANLGLALLNAGQREEALKQASAARAVLKPDASGRTAMTRRLLNLEKAMGIAIAPTTSTQPKP